ncbi:MAG: c-type cytochrome [Gallionellaceae bacterium]|jgi:cytochrome c|nr:c-type cytochrome [Gallionellaceae bacterium]
MHKRNILLTSLLVVLYGCQPGAPAQQVIAPAAAITSTAVQPATLHHAATQAANAVVSMEEGTELAKKIGCFACHSIEKKLLGPSWKNVAARFNGNPDAEIYLMNKFLNGGSGAWGSIAMPGYPHVSEADRRTLARWVLSLK